MTFLIANLSPTEQDMAHSLGSGTIYGPERGSESTYPVVRAWVIRDLLRGLYKEVVPDPKGLRLRHVKVEDRIDLERVQTDIALELDSCTLPQGITAAQARLTTLVMRRLCIKRDSVDAVIHLDDLRLDHLSLTGTTLQNLSGPALMADGLTVGCDAVFDDGFTATGYGARGAVRLLGATITGQLNLSTAILKNPDGPALNADRITVGSSAYLNGRFTATGNRSLGAVRLLGATITGQLNLSTATLKNPDGPALYADGLTVGSDAVLDEAFTATGNGELGTVRLLRASITGQLKLGGATLKNSDGPALAADGLTVGAGAHLNEGFTATGHGEHGAVRLLGASITGQLTLQKATLTNLDGPNLIANRLTARQGVFLDFARQETDLERSKAEPGRTGPKLNRSSPATKVELAGADAGHVLELSPRTLDLSVEGGKWDITGLTYRKLDKKTENLWLDFLHHGTQEYSPQPYRQFAAVKALVGDEARTRRAHIAQRNHQLARSRYEKGLLTFWGRVRSWVLRVTVGYGYHSWWAVLWLLGIIAVATTLTFVMGDSALAQPANSTVGNPSGPCPTLDLWIRTLETVPLVPLASDTRASCIYADTPQAGVYLGLTTALKALAWALLTLFIAGYTNIVRQMGP